ncbi:response regulator transcription factor [Parapedobacter sp. SGR-10]|uniref:helix-turn-helix transcriptional regulator n=1 Tax=Parapedobacter sp. SGR-10 TaxID=2710879 RepID=UPI0013D15B8A|nr:LuxR C-terminal-related transcriptional regulator [Parapedobacter sp. SGR-10]NGF55415.1 response regulator transcription factor [Parapedobacter sp. SGR-10]
MDMYEELYAELDSVYSSLSDSELLTVDSCQNSPFLDIINRSPYYITVHDVEFYRPLCINEPMRQFYGFEGQVMKGMDYFYYLKTIHTSTYHALIESISFFRKDTPGYLDLKYKLLDATGEWRKTIGTSKTIIRNERHRPKIAITVMKETKEHLDSSVYENFMSLTEREQEIVSLLVLGSTKKEIAHHLNISFGTVVSHVKNVYKKLRIKKLTELTQIVELFTMK